MADAQPFNTFSSSSSPMRRAPRGNRLAAATGRLTIAYWTQRFRLSTSPVHTKLKVFGATTWGITRTQLKEKLNYLDEHRTIGSLPEVLKQCDYIVNVLPSTPNTLGLLNGNMLENCKDRGAVFINVGRSSIIKEVDLINAIQQQWISGAILDVFEKEPLPKDSKLWTLPHVTLSPHISGVTRPQDVANFFAKNYQKFVKGEDLLNKVNLHEGY
nr:uncharacterized protein LOC116427102 [Nomia melanderi]